MVSVAAGEEFNHLLRTFSSDLRGIPIVRRIRDFFSDIFAPAAEARHGERIDGISPNQPEISVISAKEPHRIHDHAQESFSKRDHSRNQKDEGHEAHAVFNVLDMVLVDMMERLKTKSRLVHWKAPKFSNLVLTSTTC